MNTNSIDCYPLLLRLAVNKGELNPNKIKSKQVNWDVYPGLRRYVDNMGSEEQRRELFIMMSRTSRIF